MATKWLNNGEPGDDGMITVQLTNPQGAVVSTFKAKTKEELVEPLLAAQENANRRLGQLLGKPDKATPPTPPSYTDAERLDLATSLTDPAKVVETVTEITDRRFRSKEESDAYYRAEAEAFVAAHPDYYPTDANQRLLWQRLIENHYDLTRHNLGLVYDELMLEEALEVAPALPTPPRAEEPPSTPPAATAPPRVYASGLRSSDANASKPAPPQKRSLVTWEQLEKMSRAEYNEKLRDPEFRRAVDALEPKQKLAAR